MNMKPDEEKEKEVAFLPYYAINDFMRDDFRTSVIRTVIQSLSNLSETTRRPIEKQIKRVVNIPGFRNSLRAPAGYLLKPLTNVFKKDSEVVVVIIAAWIELHVELADQITSVLKQRNWDVIPIDADRSKLPGFMTEWPQGDDFNSITKAYLELFPDSHVEADDIGLLAVWLGGRLPYEDKPESDKNDLNPSQV